MQEQLDHLSLIEITGDDAVPFLQGQLSNDLNTLERDWHYSGYCSPKGRLLALLQVWRTPKAVYALLDASLLESTLKRLGMYIMRSRVNMRHISDAAIFGLKDRDSLQAIAPDLADSLTQSNTAMAQSSDIETLIALTISDRVMLIDLANSNLKLAGDYCLSTQQWLAQDIDQGLAHVSDRSSELFIPQMLNLDVLNGINFKKGCYTGQEIVARMHYLGKLKQRMFLCEVDSERIDYVAGDKIFIDAELSKVVGNLVLSVEQHSKVLAVLRLDSVAKKSPLFLDSRTKLVPATEQPYSLPS